MKKVHLLTITDLSTGELVATLVFDSILAVIETEQQFDGTDLEYVRQTVEVHSHAVELEV